MKKFKGSGYWNEHITESDNKDKADDCRYIRKSIFIGVKRMFVSVYLNQMTMQKGIIPSNTTYQYVI